MLHDSGWTGTKIKGDLEIELKELLYDVRCLKWNEISFNLNWIEFKLNWNMQITMRHVVLWSHVLVTDKSQKYKTKDCSLNFRVHMVMTGALKIQ